MVVRTNTRKKVELQQRPDKASKWTARGDCIRQYHVFLEWLSFNWYVCGVSVKEYHNSQRLFDTNELHIK